MPRGLWSVVVASFKLGTGSLVSYHSKSAWLHSLSWFPPPVHALAPQLTRLTRSHPWSPRIVVRLASTQDDAGDDLARWEAMYQEGQSKAASSEAASTGGASSRIRLVTLDLDNTLWRTGATIDAANQALADYMSSIAPNVTLRVETVMGQLFRANPARYSLKGTSHDPNKKQSPVYLTQLRKDAIQYVLDQEIPSADASTSAPDTTATLDTAFDVWRHARYASILDNLALNVPATLQDIMSLSTLDNPVIVGAITDGNSNPLDMAALAPYFDFCINAERIGVLKPDRRVYLHALRHALERHESLRTFLVQSPPDNITAYSDDQLEELVGPWWVHIGDDFVKDIVAARALNMRSIWSRELLDASVPLRAVPATTERSVQDLVQRISGLQVVTMPIGADDYLVDSLQDEFASAIVDRFDEIPGILRQWQQEAATDREERPHVEPKTVPVDGSNDGSIDGPNVASAQATKFCTACGAKLPATAKFCSVCGEKQ